MEYRLLYDLGEGYADLDLGDEKPAMNYQINDLNELKDRQAAFSLAIKLPKTANNLRKLGFIDDFDVVASAAYTPRRCLLLCDGAALTPYGSLLYVDSVDERQDGAIDCQIVSGTRDLFAEMADAETGDARWQGEWTTERLQSDNDDASAARRWPLVFTQEGWAPVGLSTTVQLYHLVPCYHFMTMIRELFDLHGYDLVSDLTRDAYLDSLYISASRIEQRTDAKAQFGSMVYFVPYPSAGYPDYMDVVPNTIAQKDLFGGLNGSRMRYYAMSEGSFAVTVIVRNEADFTLRGNRVRYSIHRGAADSSQEEVIEPNVVVGQIPVGSVYRKQHEAVELAVGEWIAVRFRMETKSPLDINSSEEAFSFDITVEQAPEENRTGPGAIFDYAAGTGFKNRKEIVQAFLQLFGAMVDVHPSPEAGGAGRKGTVRMYTFEELYRRRDAGLFEDWSDRLVLDSERSAGFAVGRYAQRNVIALKENTDDGTRSTGLFTIDNRTLEDEKTLFTIGVEAGRNIAYAYAGGTRAVGVIPTLEREIETDDQGNETVKLSYKGCTPHLVRLTSDRVSLRNVSGFRIDPTYQSGDAPLSLPVAVSVPMQELVNKYYVRIAQMLRHAKTLSAYFNLTAKDIDQLDLFTPVWIGHYGAFFYISKINNFVAGRPTKVDLVRM